MTENIANISSITNNNTNVTPRSFRLHIGFFGPINSGKSSLVNALCSQNVSIVSAFKGTTSDPVSKNVELFPLGACTLIDTPGFGDTSSISSKRFDTLKTTILKCDIAVFTSKVGEAGKSNNSKILEQQTEIKKYAKSLNIPTLEIFTFADLIDDNEKQTYKNKSKVVVSSKTKYGFDDLINALTQINSNKAIPQTVLVHKLKSTSPVILVMPQDKGAPKARLIAPEQQVLRELLDANIPAFCTTPQTYKQTLDILKSNIQCVVTDSKVFKEIYNTTPKDIPLTSFSILFAEYKGDIDTYRQGAKSISELKQGDKVLVAECCTHAPVGEDIGRVAIPSLLKHKVKGVEVDFCSGDNLPQNLSDYKLVIQCGGCMFTRSHILNRINICKQKGVLITNYGMAIAFINGFLNKVSL